MGYETDLFVIQPVEDNFICLICHQVLEKPTSACDNEHVFCAECINMWKEQGDSCPKCRLIMIDPMPICHPVQCNVLNLQVRCPESEVDEGNKENATPRKSQTTTSITTPGRTLRNGKKTQIKQVVRRPTSCPWVGTLATFEIHRNSECNYKMAACQDCNETVSVADMKMHRLNFCTHRLVKCTMCNQMLKSYSLGVHATMCSYRLVSCQHCQIQVTQRDLGNLFSGHLSVCPKVPVPCKLACQGCTMLVPRENLEAHCFDAYHFQLLSTALEDVSKTLEDEQKWERVKIVWDLSRDRIPILKEKTTVQSSTIDTKDFEFFLEAYPDQYGKISISFCVTAKTRAFLGAPFDPVSIKWNGAHSFHYKKRHNAANFPKVAPIFAVQTFSFPLEMSDTNVTLPLTLSRLEASFGDLDSVVISATFKFRKPEVFRVKCANY